MQGLRFVRQVHFSLSLSLSILSGDSSSVKTTLMTFIAPKRDKSERGRGLRISKDDRRQGITDYNATHTHTRPSSVLASHYFCLFLSNLETRILKNNIANKEKVRGINLLRHKSIGCNKNSYAGHYPLALLATPAGPVVKHVSS